MKHLYFIAFMLGATLVHAQTKGADTGNSPSDTQQQIDAMQDLMNRINDPNHPEYQKAKAMRDALQQKQKGINAPLDEKTKQALKWDKLDQKTASEVLSPADYDVWKQQQLQQNNQPLSPYKKD
jgi:hypothetical protein